uniref:Uncharacterized protein n=1 Tax=Fagus sylvatica TaxID=28930 RepID=A0A2N9IXT3_FAGSY
MGASMEVEVDRRHLLLYTSLRTKRGGGGSSVVGFSVGFAVEARNGVVGVLRWLGFLLGLLLKHETGWLGLAGVVVVNG